MNQQTLYAIIGVLVLLAIALGYGWYAESQKSASLRIELGSGGISVDAN